MKVSGVGFRVNRGRRYGFCNTKFMKFYPVCYTDESDTADNTFGPKKVRGPACTS